MSGQINMFTGEIEPERPPKIIPRYDGPRHSRRDPSPNGYAAKPGTGPDGETCKSCTNVRRFSTGDGTLSGKTWNKCDVFKRFWAWTSGRATDVLAGSPACSFWNGENDGL